MTLSLTVIAAAGLMSAASSQPWIVQTGCDTLSVAPPRFRVQFRVENLGEGEEICQVTMFSGRWSGTTPPDTCSPPILQCDAPPGWLCWPGDFSTSWFAAGWDPRTPCIAPGEALDSFAVITDELQFCCYVMAFYTNAIPEPFFWDTYCFTCDEPVPARSRTWGQLKLLYR